MSERRYTLSEIDRMRKFLLKRSKPDFSGYGIGPEGIEPRGRRAIDEWRAAAEEELRTILMAGVDPAEFVVGQSAPAGEPK